MSFFGKLFGVKKEEKGPSTEDAIQKLRSTEEMLIKKQEFLEKKIEQEVAIAKKNGTTNKRGKLTLKLQHFLCILGKYINPHILFRSRIASIKT